MASALVVSMMGCSESPTSTEPEDPATAVQLRLKGNIAAITPSSRVNESGFEANDKIGVYVSSTGTLSSSNNMLDNEGFTYSGGNIEAPEGKEVYWGTPDVRLSVWAYYPYVESITDNAAYPFSVKTDQSSAENFYNSDFITASATNLPPQSEPIELTFNHSLSKIEITLAAGTGITADELIAATKSLYINGAIVDGAINLSNGVATVGTTASSVTPFKTGDLAYSAIVYPQQSELTFRFEMGEDVYSYTTNVDYTAGHRYKYKFTINTRDPQEMTLTAVSINAWEDDGEEENVEMSDIITFTDPKFKEYLLQAKIRKYIEFNPVEGSWCYSDTEERIDANNDGEISIAEAEKVECLNISNLDITDLSELHYFTNLRWLDCINSESDNKLTALDLSNNTQLIILSCAENELTSLDISGNENLRILVCNNNKLATLNLLDNRDLHSISCGGNQLTTLDVSRNTALVDISCDSNQLAILDVSNNTALKQLSCNGNQLTALDVSKNTALEWLNCRDNQLTALDVSSCTALKHLFCDDNQLTALDVSKNTALQYLWCLRNQLTALDVSNNTALETLYCGSNKLTLLDVSNNTELIELYCYDNQLGVLDLSDNTVLTQLDCSFNQLTSLDLSNNTALTKLSSGGNQLSTLDLSSNTALTSLGCGGNQLVVLDLSNNTALTTLYCQSNQFTALDLSNNAALTDLHCPNNRLGALDLSNNTALTYLSCGGNKLTTLDVSKNTNLLELFCTPMNDAEGNNLLTTIYIADGQEITTLEKPEATQIVEKE